MSGVEALIMWTEIESSMPSALEYEYIIYEYEYEYIDHKYEYKHDQKYEYILNRCVRTSSNGCGRRGNGGGGRGYKSNIVATMTSNLNVNRSSEKDRFFVTKQARKLQDAQAES